MKEIVLMCLISMITFTSFSQVGKNFIDENYIEVNGKAEMEVAPDEIYLKIIIREKDNKGKQTLEELEGLMVDKLVELNVDIEKDLKILDISSNFKNYWIGKKDIFTSKEYQVLTHDALTAGKVFRALESIDISNISIDRIAHSEIEKLRKEVKIEAMKAAKSKAQYLAEAAGQTIGKAIHIQEIDNFNFGRNENLISNISVGYYTQYESKPEEPNIEFGKIKLQYEIAAKFKLE